VPLLFGAPGRASLTSLVTDGEPLRIDDENLITENENLNMVKNETRPLSPAQIQQTSKATTPCSTLETMRPQTRHIQKTNATGICPRMRTSQQEETQSVATAAADRDNAVAGEWGFTT